MSDISTGPYAIIGEGPPDLDEVVNEIAKSADGTVRCAVGYGLARYAPCRQANSSPLGEWLCRPSKYGTRGPPFEENLVVRPSVYIANGLHMKAICAKRRCRRERF
jgi:hypothetical protein